MAIQTVFKRYELKYMLTREQKEKIITALEPHMSLDKYGRTTIRNLYLDTDNYLLIRRSIEKPSYKEKLRVRSYGLSNDKDMVFVELKKKYKSVVYKRRITLPQEESLRWLAGFSAAPKNDQISQEIDYFLDYYKTLAPRVFLSYEREAYYAKDGSDFRVTFDDNILCRQTDLTLSGEVYGTSLLPEDAVLMELKCSGGIPLWLTEFLSKEHIYKTSFSKYGTAYRSLIYPNLQKEKIFSLSGISQTNQNKNFNKMEIFAC